MLIILRQPGYGIEFFGPITNEKLLLSAFEFVYDMDYVQTAWDNDNVDDVLHKIQEGMNLWKSLLRTSSGAIETSVTKIDWVLINLLGLG